MSKDIEMEASEKLAIGNRLLEVRELLKIKQTRLAKELGMSSSYISDIEKGKISPGFNFLHRLRKNFYVNLEWLLYNNGVMFVGEEGEETRLEKLDFREHREIVYKMLGYMCKSEYLMRTVTAYFIRIFNEEEDYVRKDMKKGYFMKRKEEDPDKEGS